MSRVVSLFTLALLLSFCCIIHAARLNVAFHDHSSQREDVEAKKAEIEEESCEGVQGKEDCLMRRTLVAHLDYIYTQHKPKN